MFMHAALGQRSRYVYVSFPSRRSNLRAKLAVGAAQYRGLAMPAALESVLKIRDERFVG